jgi:cutinase
MKFFATLSLLAGLATALPTAVEIAPAASEEGIEARQLFGNTRNELQTGGTCPRVIFIFARGSTESGNLVCCAPTSTALGMYLGIEVLTGFLGHPGPLDRQLP